MTLAAPTLAAQQQHTAVPANLAPQELRLALAMRGGVSLAVWIGGAVSEIERLRRAGGAETVQPNQTYRALLELGGYRTDSLLVDVLAGASAGGLNGVVYAASQVHRFDIARLRDLWIEVGDIEALTRATTSAQRARESLRVDPKERYHDAVRPPSLLNGDSYFYENLRRKLAELINDPVKADAPPVNRLDLVLSATLFAPAEVQLRLSRLATIRERRPSALFRFRERRERSDLAGTASTADGAPDAHDAAARLAMAARSTSSFPGAFEPARIAVHAIGDGARTSPTDGLVFGPAFVAPPTEARGVAEVMDGGVLDNIPVAAAIRAVVDAPAEGPTARVLVYLHPSPPVVAEDGQAATAPMAGATDGGLSRLGSPRAFATVVRTLVTRAGQESLLADVEELLAVNDAARRRADALRAIFAEFLGPARRNVDTIVANREYRRQQLDEVVDNLDVGEILAALRRPEETTAAGVGPPAPLAKWPEADDLGLRDALLAEIRTRPRRPGLSGVTIRDSTAVLIGWTRDLEARLDEEQRPPVGQLKRRAYRLRALAEWLDCRHLVSWGKRADERGRLPPGARPPLGAWVADTWEGLDRHADGVTVDGMCAGCDGEETFTELLERLDRETVAAPTAEDGLGDAIYGAVTELARAVRTVLDEAEWTRPEVSDPAFVPFAVLETVELERLAEAFDAIVAQYVPLRLVGSAPDSQMDFAQLTGLAPVAPQLNFRDLLAERRDEEGKHCLPEAPLRPGDKLCGDELGNFAAFLSAKWRANDWMWGRLDGARTIVDLLLDPARVRAYNPDPDAIVAAVRKALLTAPLPGWDDHLARLWMPQGGRPLEERIRAAHGAGGEAWEELVREVRDLVAYRLQAEILASELPVVEAVDHDGHGLPTAPPQPLAPEPLQEEVAGYTVGLQRPGALGDARRVRIGMRLGLVGFGALRPDGDGFLAVTGRAIVSLLKPVYLALVFVAATLRRGLVVAALAIAALQATFWQADRTSWWSRAGSGPPPWWWWLLVGGTALTVAGGALHLLHRRRSARRARGRSRNGSPWSGVLVLGFVALALAGGVALWGRGGTWAVLCVVGAALTGVALLRWWQWRGRPDHSWRQVDLWGWYALTPLIAAAGAVAGSSHWPVEDRPITLGWDRFGRPFWLLIAIAVIVTLLGTFWMRVLWHWAVAPLLTLGAYLAIANPFRQDDWPAWVRALTLIAAIGVPAFIAVIAAIDVERRRAACGQRGLERIGTSVALLVVGGLVAWRLVDSRVASIGSDGEFHGWSAATWAVLAVVSAAYSLTLLTTYVDVFPERPGFRGSRALGSAAPAPSGSPA